MRTLSHIGGDSKTLLFLQVTAIEKIILIVVVLFNALFHEIVIWIFLVLPSLCITTPKG